MKIGLWSPTSRKKRARCGAPRICGQDREVVWKCGLTQTLKPVSTLPVPYYPYHRSDRRRVPQGLKPSSFDSCTARLKSCPDTKQDFRRPVKSCPHAKLNFSGTCEVVPIVQQRFSAASEAVRIVQGVFRSLLNGGVVPEWYYPARALVGDDGLPNESSGLRS
jgi:hypothetical protein